MKNTSNRETPPEAVSAEDVKFAQIGRAFVSLIASAAGGKIDAAALAAVPAPSADAGVPAAQSGKKAEEPSDEKIEGIQVTAPMNGTFYRSSGPGKPELAKEGDTVKKGQAVCILEAMKMFNEVKAPAAGKIVKFIAAHGAQVVKGQVLAVIA